MIPPRRTPTGAVTEPDQPSRCPLAARDGWIALGYFVVYFIYLFWRQESEIAHWATMVALPFAIAYASLRLQTGKGDLTAAMESLGLRRGNLTRGIGWAVLAGTLITAYQVFFGGRAEAIQELIHSGQALWLFPLSFILMLLLAGFTEEVLFRGFLQNRLAHLFHSRWLAVLVSAFLFGLYHLPYAYFNPSWPSHGDWGAAWVAALGNGVPGGLLLGGLFVVSRGNLLACVALHSLINAAPVMTLIRFGGG